MVRDYLTPAVSLGQFVVGDETSSSTSPIANSQPAKSASRSPPPKRPGSSATGRKLRPVGRRVVAWIPSSSVCDVTSSRIPGLSAGLRGHGPWRRSASRFVASTTYAGVWF